MEFSPRFSQFISHVKINERYNIFICMKGLSDFIILKFNNYHDAKKAFTKLKNARLTSISIEITDCYGEIFIDGTEITYLSFSKIEEQKEEYFD